ncbi:MAG: type VI secretion system baseplate subunit TssK [Alphaproteobacteria bacterium]|nr:type VI secretion system baseplate subunit TssK [Alphaproteobacteria bacterium]
MTWTNRVVWQEGMFLRAQHFQQQDRWVEGLVRARTAFLQPYPWGLAEMAVDQDALGSGRFALSSAVGVFEDGTPFAIPTESDHPAPLDLTDAARNAVVYLAMPIRQAGAAEIADDGGRYGPSQFEAPDTHSATPQPAPLQIARLRLRYLLDGQDRSGYLCIGLARIAAVASNRRVTLDDGWIPPALVCAAAEPLGGFLAELAGTLNQRGETLAARLTAGSDAVALANLQAVNRWQTLIAHWEQTRTAHPEELYRAVVQMAGELATFSETGKRPKPYPGYRHDDLQQSFAPVMADLRRALSGEHETINIPLQDRRYGVRIGPIGNRAILQSSRFVLTVRADAPTEALLRLFPNQVKIGAIEHIRELVNEAGHGIGLRPLSAPPPDLPAAAGAACFELDRGSAHWQQLQNSSGFAIHVSGDVANLRLELWAIRG